MEEEEEAPIDLLSKMTLCWPVLGAGVRTCDATSCISVYYNIPLVEWLSVTFQREMTETEIPFHNSKQLIFLFFFLCIINYPFLVSIFLWVVQWIIKI